MLNVFDHDYMEIEYPREVYNKAHELADAIGIMISSASVVKYFRNFFGGRSYGAISWYPISVAQTPTLSVYTEKLLGELADGGIYKIFAVNTVNDEVLAMTQEIPVADDERRVGLREFYAQLRVDGVPLMLVGHYGLGLRETRNLSVYYPEGELDSARDLLGRFKDLAKMESIYKNKTIVIARDGNSIEFVKTRRSSDDDSVVLTDHQRELLERYIVYPLLHPEECHRLGIQAGRGVLLEGPPGTGKTATSRWLLRKLEGKVTFLLATGRMVADSGASAITTLFDIAAELAPSVIWFEDLDLFGGSRSGGILSPTILAELLTGLDGVQDRGDVSIVATTNMVDTLDEALAKRPYRFDVKITYDLPDEPLRKRLLDVFIREMTQQGFISTDALSNDIIKKTAGLSGAYLKELVDSAALRALERGAEKVGSSDFEVVLPQVIEENKRQLSIGFLRDEGDQNGEETNSEWGNPEGESIAV